MADITFFSFRPGNSSLHLLDTRMKFFIICLVCLSMMPAGFIACFFYFMLLVFFLKKSGFHLFSMVGRMKLFLLLLFFVFLSRALTTEGNPAFSVYKFNVSEQGLAQGALAAFKFLLVMLTGLVFSSTTRPASIKAAVQWILKPVPFVPENRVAVMISLALCFMPVILRQAREVSDARKARCGNLQKNPVQKIMGLVLPLLKKTFVSADHLVLAMESRCYNDDRTDPEFRPSGKETIFFLGAVLICLCFFVFQ